MNSYNLTLVLKPDLEEKARLAFLEDMKKKIAGEDGKVGKEDLWGAKELAYPIKKHTRGYFAHFEFETDAKVAKGLDKILKLEEDILRYLLIRQ